MMFQAFDALATRSVVVAERLNGSRIMVSGLSPSVPERVIIDVLLDGRNI